MRSYMMWCEYCGGACEVEHVLNPNAAHKNPQARQFPAESIGARALISGGRQVRRQDAEEKKNASRR